MLINYIRKSYDKTCLTMVIPWQVAVIIAKPNAISFYEFDSETFNRKFSPISMDPSIDYYVKTRIRRPVQITSKILFLQIRNITPDRITIFHIRFRIREKNVSSNICHIVIQYLHLD